MMLLTDITDEALPSTPIKLVFFDVDGTLLRADGSYSRATARELQRLRERGIRLCAATGRPQFATRFLAQELGLTDFGVYCTGAHVYSPASSQALSEDSMSREQVASLLQRVRSLGVYYEIYSADSYCVDQSACEHLTQVHAEHLRATPVRSTADGWLTGRKVQKFLVAADGPEGARTLRQLEVEFAPLVFAFAQFPAFPSWNFASVVAAEACKVRAFERVLDHYGLISAEVASFGDSQSDMVFLAQAGAGVAMGNASAEVKAVANFTTKSVSDDGVAYALARLIR